MYPCLAVQPTSVAGGARVSGEAQPVCGIAFGKGDPLSSSERLSMGSARLRATTLPRRGAQLLTTVYTLRGAEHKHWAETLNITPFFLKCVINGSLVFFKTVHLHTHACKILLILYQSIGSFRVNSNSDSQVSVSNIAQIIPKITLVSIMKACQILGCNSEYCWRYSLSNFLFCIS